MKTSFYLKLSDTVINLLIAFFTVWLFAFAHFGMASYMFLGAWHMLSYLFNIAWMLKSAPHLRKRRVWYMSAVLTYGFLWFMQYTFGGDYIEKPASAAEVATFITPAILGFWYISICVRELTELADRTHTTIN